MKKIHLLPELPTHGKESCSEIVLGWYSESSFDFMRWFPTSGQWKLVPSGEKPRRNPLAWSELEYPSNRELKKLNSLVGEK